MRYFANLCFFSFAFLLLSCTSTPPAVEGPHPLSILQGLTSANSTQLNILLHKTDLLTPKLIDTETGAEIAPASSQEKTFEGSLWRVLRLAYQNLQPAHIYSLQILDPQKQVLDTRVLKTLDPTRHELRFVVSSCLDDTYEKEQREMWVQALAHQPDLFFLIGDNIYAREPSADSVVDPASLWNRYVHTRNHLEIYRSHELVPVLATWNAHDYGMLEGNRTYPYQKEALDIFSTFFSQDPVPGLLEKGPGVASLVTLGDQNFFLMDDRTFRSSVTDPEETHWGKDQEEWLWAHLPTLKGPLWLLDGDQFFGKYNSYESYEGMHPTSFAKFLDRLRKSKRRVFFVSGDRQITEVMGLEEKETGFPTFEVTTSAMHAPAPPATEKSQNPRQLVGTQGSFNYALIESQLEKNIQIKITAFGPAQKMLFTRDFVYEPDWTQKVGGATPTPKRVKRRVAPHG